MGEELVLKNGDSVRTIPTPGFNYFSHLSLRDDGTIYTIASGPCKPSSLLKIDPVCFF